MGWVFNSDPVKGYGSHTDLDTDTVSEPGITNISGNTAVLLIDCKEVIIILRADEEEVQKVNCFKSSCINSLSLSVKKWGPVGPDPSLWANSDAFVNFRINALLKKICHLCTQNQSLNDRLKKQQIKHNNNNAAITTKNNNKTLFHHYILINNYVRLICKHILL